MKKPIAKGSAVAAVAFSVLPMQDIAKLSIKEACQRFADRATISQRAFAEMGKLHHAIAASLRKGQTIYGELRKLGVKDSTISNASYASRVWAELIAKEQLTETDYDGLSFAECYAICRAMSDKSARKLSGPEVAVIVRAQPNDFDAELDSIFTTGMTVAEAEAQAKAAADLAAKAEADRKAKMEAEAAARAKAEQEAAVAAALEAERKRQAETVAALAASTPPAPAEAPSIPAATEPAPSPVPTAESTAASTPMPRVLPDPIAPAAPVATAPLVPPTVPVKTNPANVVPMPVAEPDPDEALPELLAALDELLVTSSGMSRDAQEQVFAKLNDVMGLMAETLNQSTAAA